MVQKVRNLSCQKLLQIDQKFMKPSKGQIKSKIQNFKRQEREQIGQMGGEIDHWWKVKQLTQNSKQQLVSRNIHATWEGNSHFFQK